MTHPSTAAGLREREPTRTRLYARLWRWHFFAAFLVIPFVLWQSSTGLLYLWSQWWMDRAYPQLRFVEPAGASLPPSRQIAAALASITPAAAPTDTTAPASHAHHGAHMGAGPAVSSILISDDPRRSTTVLIQDERGLTYPVFVDPYSARVLGTISGTQWLPGVTRSLHGGWPLGKPGSWLLEMGDCWAIVTLLTGLYLWWPRGRGLMAALWPRLRGGARVVLRDLHACVAVWFSIVLLFFLVSALPWTAFWGGELLPRAQTALGQESPAGFSPGGASVSQLTSALPSLDTAVSQTRERQIKGTLDIRLAPWPGAPLYMTNVRVLPSDDRIVHADARTGAISAQFTNADLPIVPRLIALGIHVHQGDFGAANLWLNTAFATALMWLSATGIVSWWIRRPGRGLGAPPGVQIRWPRGVMAAGAGLCALLPLLGASVLCILAVNRMLARRA